MVAIQSLKVHDSIAGTAVFCYRLLRRHDQSLKLNEETLAIYEKVFGPEHPDTLLRRQLLAIDFMNLGRDNEADALDGGES